MRATSCRSVSTSGPKPPASPQVGADRPAGVGLVTQYPPGSGPGPAESAAADLDPGHDRLERQ
jgi:hypothetical protein